MAMAQWTATQITTGANLDTATQRWLDRESALALGGLARDQARVADLYFERVQNRNLSPGEPMALVYRVYVWTEFPRPQVGGLLRALARRLQVAKQPRAASLAERALTLAAAYPSGDPEPLQGALAPEARL